MIRSIVRDGFEAILAISSKNSKNGRSIYMASITKEQEEDLDNKYPIEVNFLNGSHVVMPEDTVCYGNIDYSDVSEDMDVLESFNLLEKNFNEGTFVYSNFNYENASANTRKGYPTWDVISIMQQTHCAINKPERSIIFFMGKSKR